MGTKPVLKLWKLESNRSENTVLAVQQTDTSALSVVCVLLHDSIPVLSGLLASVPFDGKH